MSIEEMKNVDVRMVKREELADIREVEVNKRKSQEGAFYGKRNAEDDRSYKTEKKQIILRTFL